MIVGITSPGAMGAAMAKVLVENGAEVRTLLAGRSVASRARAAAAGMRDADDPAFVASDVILSILPPGNALEMAERLRSALAAAVRQPVYVDCNAVSPQSVARIAAVVETTGAPFVDGSIIGLPASTGRRGATLVVSGPHAARIEPLAALGIPVRVLNARNGAASALKMSYAGITKGTLALGSAMILAAARAGAAPELRHELAATQPGLLSFLERGVTNMHEKTYRWVAEMREIADFAGTDRAEHGIYEAVARLYERLTADHAGSREESRDLDRFFDDAGEG